MKDNLIENVSDVVFIPGLNNTSEVWDGVVTQLPSYIRCHTPNCPILDDVDTIAEELLSKLPSQFHLCGFSFGGYVAAAMIAKAPERVASLALIGSIPKADDEEQIEKRKMAISRAEFGEHSEMVASQSHFVFHPDNVGNQALEMLRSKIVSDYGSGRFIAHQQACINRPDRMHLIASLNIPVLVLSGETDVVIPVNQQREMAKRINRATFKVVEIAGHMAPLENPKALAESLLSWLLKTK